MPLATPLAPFTKATQLRGWPQRGTPITWRNPLPGLGAGKSLKSQILRFEGPSVRQGSTDSRTEGEGGNGSGCSAGNSPVKQGTCWDLEADRPQKGDWDSLVQPWLGHSSAWQPLQTGDCYDCLLLLSPVRPVLLRLGQFCPREDVCLETFLVVTALEESGTGV